MAAGVPVVLPDHGSFPEIIGETNGGLLYEKSEPSGIFNGLNDMLRNTGQAEEYGEQGRLAVHKKYSNEQLAKELVENILAPLVSTK